MKLRHVLVAGVVALLPLGGCAVLRADDRRAENELQAAAVRAATENAGLIAKDLRAMGER